MGRDVLQLKMMLHALDFFRPNTPEFDVAVEDANIYTEEAVEAGDRFRAAQGWQTSVPGYVSTREIERLWTRLEEAGSADDIRRRLLELQRIRR